MESKYFMLPKPFAYNDRFRKLSSQAKLLYMYYWNELHFPLEPLRVAEDGQPLIRDEWAHAKLFLGMKTDLQAEKARRELQKLGLICPMDNKTLLVARHVPEKEKPKPEQLPPNWPKPRPQPYPAESQTNNANT